MPTNLFSILSLDGGGVRGYLTAKLLESMEHYLAAKRGAFAPIGLDFDLIAGTSTGGIIALGLAIGKSAAELAALYEENLPKIFGHASRRSRLQWLTRPRYASEPMATCLQEFFGGQTLEDVTTDVCVPAVILQTGKPRLHKSDYLDRNVGRFDERLVDVALATSAAPTFLQAHSMKHSTHLIDGALCANNPAMIALVDARQFERASKRGTAAPRSDADIVMVSIGTGTSTEMPFDGARVAGGGLWQWKDPRILLEIMLEAQGHAAHHQVEFLLRERYHRVNPNLKQRIALDDADRIHLLKNYASVEAPDIEFLDRWFVGADSGMKDQS